jgi:hypothetical protein
MSITVKINSGGGVNKIEAKIINPLYLEKLFFILSPLMSDLPTQSFN